jgi:HPt (histidine-containing phosphotransfer) domain-containing protein
VQLIETYLRDVKNKVPQLRQFAQVDDINSLVEVAHSLKGASVNLGVRLFTQQCREIEELAPSISHDDINQMVIQAAEQAEVLVSELTSLYL